ncbi:putative transposase [Variovorax paradoxus B4]|uniref:Putative transposase n=1 Tax=Variovorax paradoxus B4 TaxID=1246301 RepID=T1XKL2_VARPD|nr:putative transposase [Variovorax paradoxus B4]
MLDNPNIHFGKCFDDVLGARAANTLLRWVRFHYTAKHASWLNMAENEIGILTRHCLNRHFPSQQLLRREVDAWQTDRNALRRTIEWKFTRQDADHNLGRHCVSELTCWCASSFEYAEPTRSRRNVDTAIVDRGGYRSSHHTLEGHHPRRSNVAPIEFDDAGVTVGDIEQQARRPQRIDRASATAQWLIGWEVLRGHVQRSSLEVLKAGKLLQFEIAGCGGAAFGHATLLGAELGDVGDGQAGIGRLARRHHRRALLGGGADQVEHAIGHQAEAVVAEVGQVTHDMHVDALAIGRAERVVVIGLQRLEGLDEVIDHGQIFCSASGQEVRHVYHRDTIRTGCHHRVGAPGRRIRPQLD